MGKTNKENPLFAGEYHYGILVGSLSCFDIVSNTGLFFKWMHTTYPNIKDTVILEGYQCFIDLLIGMISEALRNSDGVGLNNHDIMFDRVLFHGVAPDKSQPTNNLGKLFVILQKRVEQIKETNEVTKFRRFVKEIKLNIISVFDEYVNSNTINSSPFSDEEGKLWCTRALVWMYLVNAQTGFPHAHIYNPLHSNLPDDIIEEGTPEFDLFEYRLYEKDTALCGFCYVLEYLLSKIFPNYLNSEMLTRLHTADTWKAVDLFFTDLNNDFFEERRDDYDYAWYFKIFKAKAPISEEILTPILEEYKIPYLSTTEELEQLFLWYDIGFLDATSTIFTGNVAFTVLLDGEVQNHRKQDNPEPIQIRVIKHPVPEGNYYSYAILLARYGWNTDMSGWILCYNCSTDFSGTGGYYNDLIQGKLEGYEDILEIKEYSIEESRFKRFCLERDVSYREDIIGQQLSELEYMKMVVDEYKMKTQELNMKLALLSNKEKTSRGLITELLTYYHTSKMPGVSADWNITHNSHQLDVIYSHTDNNAVIIECKHSDSIDLNEEFKKLARKIEASTMFKEKPEGVFYFYTRPKPETDILYNELMGKYRREGVVIHNYVVLSDLLKIGKSKPSVWNGKKLDKVNFLMEEKTGR